MKNRRRWVTAALLVAAVMVSAPRLVNGLLFFDRTIDIPTITSGRVLESGRDVELTRAQIASLNGWLQNHRGGWSRNVVTYPPSHTHLILDSEAEKDAISLTIWLDPDGSAASLVILEGDYPPKVLAEVFPAAELAQLKAVAANRDVSASTDGQGKHG